MLRPKL